MTIHTHLKKARIDDILIESVHIYRIELHVVFCLYHFLFEKVGHLQISGSVVFLVINNSFLYMAFPILVAFCLTYLPYLIIIQPFLNIPPSFFFSFNRGLVPSLKAGVQRLLYVIDTMKCFLLVVGLLYSLMISFTLSFPS